MRLGLEWAEEHWEALGLMVSIVCALTVAIALAVAFNVISTRLDDFHHDAVGAAPLTYNDRSEYSDGSESGSVIVASLSLSR